jgi:hypothetical protein
MKHYKVYLPDYFYALNYYGYNLTDVKNNIRTNLNLNRLPNNTIIILKN